MPALLERPKLSSAMARALHRHVMVERERKRQEEEEVDKMMEQKMKEEQERRRKKEMEERMSLEETKEQILKLQEKLQALQEEKHQLFLQLKKVLHEEEKRRRKEQSDMTTLAAAAYQQGMAVHAGTHILNMQGSPSGHNRAATLIPADRAKQMFGPPVITTRHFATQPAFPAGTPEHGQYQGSQAGHSPYAVGQGQHTVPVSYASSQSIRGEQEERTEGVAGSCDICRVEQARIKPTSHLLFFPPPRTLGFLHDAVLAPAAAWLRHPRSLPRRPGRIHPAQHHHPSPEAAGTREPAVRVFRFVHPSSDAPPGPPPQPGSPAGLSAPGPNADHRQAHFGLHSPGPACLSGDLPTAATHVWLPSFTPGRTSAPFYTAPARSAFLPQVSPGRHTHTNTHTYTHRLLQRPTPPACPA